LLLPVILLYETCFFREQWRKRIEQATGRTWSRNWTVGAWAGFGVAAAVVVGLVMASTEVIRLTSDFPSRDFNGVERLMTQARVQIFHLSQLIWPTPARLNLDHDFAISRGILNPTTTLPAILICIALLAGAVYFAVRWPRYGFPILAYAVFHVMEAGPIGLEKRWLTPDRVAGFSRCHRSFSCRCYSQPGPTKGTWCGRIPSNSVQT
jgi:hypothetical protein